MTIHRRVTRDITLVLVLMALPCGAQTAIEVATWISQGLSSGRTWQRLTPPAKVAYLNGAADALTLLDAGEFLKHVPALTPEEVAKALDRFYDESENLPIPILQAMRLVTMKANGAPPADVAEALARTRRLIAEYEKKHQ